MELQATINIIKNHTKSEALLLLFLKSIQEEKGSKDWVCFTGNEIADFLKLGVRSVMRARNSLMKKKLIKVENRNPRKNDHTLTTCCGFS